LTETSLGPRLVVALDVATSKEALDLAVRLTPALCRLKVGLELFTTAGPALIERLIARGYDIFLDLKYHDIPTTVARACAVAARLGVWMINVHVLGGPAMLTAARAAVDDAPRRPLLVGVTVLTSMNETELGAVGLAAAPAEIVGRLAALARNSGLDGVVCSPLEAAALRRRFGPAFVLVTPGIRLPGAAPDDQRRTLAPVEAVAAGADYLVIGRPITRASDPEETLRSIVATLDAA
jgi:orotidine-5'-phosphate decarboxylase